MDLHREMLSDLEVISNHEMHTGFWQTGPACWQVLKAANQA
uniref:Metal-dependent phosphohydrolase n=1 Tax=Macrostomum lignano TaxID=282301 RepID=A0A1I8FA30_9PLAT